MAWLAYYGATGHLMTKPRETNARVLCGHAGVRACRRAGVRACRCVGAQAAGMQVCGRTGWGGTRYLAPSLNLNLDLMYGTHVHAHVDWHTHVHVPVHRHAHVHGHGSSQDLVLIASAALCDVLLLDMCMWGR